MNGTSAKGRAAYLDYLARCRQVFTPFAPIELPEFFAGRAHVIEDIRAELEAPGRHVAIYGERGVGKTSLAMLLYFFAGYDDDKVHIYRCHEDTIFDDIGAALLTDAGYRFGLNGLATETGRDAGAALGPVSGRVERHTTVTYRAVRDARAISLDLMLSVFRDQRRLLIIDEFDRVKDTRTKRRLAELIKHFSDARSQTKIVVVGVAETLEQLIGQHQSLSRSLAQIGLKRMDDAELADIIARGSQRIGAAFENEVARRIVRLADGFPHFVHLICLYAAVYAGEVLQRDPRRQPRVGQREYHLGLKSAIEKSEHSLQEAYERAIVTTRRKSDIYELTLRAMALAEERDVQVRKLAEYASLLAGKELRPEKFSNALGQLIKPERGRIITKVRDGYYKYANPLMRPYIRFLLEYENLTQHDGQMVFPFM